MDACSADKRQYRRKSRRNDAVSLNGDILDTTQLYAHCIFGPNTRFQLRLISPLSFVDADA